VTVADIGIEFAGWLGAALILLAYFLISAAKVTSRSPSYQWMNVAGAAGLVANGWWHHAIPSTALNVVWMAIGVTALWKIVRQRA
jgi:hypothetical protein